MPTPAVRPRRCTGRRPRSSTPAGPPASGRRQTSYFTGRTSRPTARCGTPPGSRSSTTASWCRTIRPSPAGRCTAAGLTTSRTRTSCRSCCRITAIRSATATSGCASSAPRPDRTALMRIRVCLGLALLLPLGPLARAQSPPAARVVPKIDTLHGEVREDDYFWLRDKKNPEVLAYLEAENAYTAAAMQHTEPLQEQLYREMLGRIKETDLTVPYRNHGFWYYNRTVEGKPYPIYCRKKGSLDAPEDVILDQNALAQGKRFHARSEEHTSELQSRGHLVCRLLLEKKKKNKL